MDKEAIQEIAKQLGKGVNWVTDTLMPFMYNYCEYKFIMDTIGAILFALVALAGIGMIVTVYKLRKASDSTYWDSVEEGLLFCGIAVTFLAVVFVAGFLDGAIAWSVAPEVTFVKSMT